MEKKLFVGNLSAETTEASLRALFAEAGEVVTVTLIRDTASGLPRGFIEMGTEAEAEAAMRKFAGYPQAGRQMFIGEYRRRA